MGTTFGILLLSVCMFLVVSTIMKINTGGIIKSALALAGCIGFFIIDANLIMKGSYNAKKGDKKKDKVI